MTWSQAVYASIAGRPDRAGGWGLVESTVAADDGESLNLLLARVVNRIEEVEPTPDFASAERLNERVRSLEYLKSDTHLVWWHAVVAGDDATGRPGNVVTHSAMTDEVRPGFRPIDMWDSPNWLMPYGAVEVEAIRLSPGIRTEPRIESSVLSCLAKDSTTVEAFLSAVASCFENNQTLVLLSTTQTDFVEWVSILSILTSGTAAADIPFSTFVRFGDFRNRARKFEILGAPNCDFGQFAAYRHQEVDSFLYLDLDNLNDIVSNDDVYQFDGQVWSASTVWQDSFFRMANLSRKDIFELVEFMDTTKLEMSNMGPLHPQLPLAAALLKRDGIGHPDAAHTIGIFSESGVQNFEFDDELRVLVETGLVLLQDTRRDEKSLSPSELVLVNDAEPESVAMQGDPMRSILEELSFATGKSGAEFSNWFREWFVKWPLFRKLQYEEGEERTFFSECLLHSIGVKIDENPTKEEVDYVSTLANWGAVFPSEVIELLEDWLGKHDTDRRATPHKEK